MEAQPQNLTPMNPIHNSPPVPAHRTTWQKLGGNSLSISLILHGMLVVIGVIWIFQIIPQPEPKAISFLGKSGGTASAADSKMQVKRVQMAQPNLSRIVAKDATGISLPEPEKLTRITSLGGLSSGTLAVGQGGIGNGGGPGLGSALDIGMSDGSGAKNPFGMVNPDKGALVGTFYDLKQTSDREPTHMTDDQMRSELKEIVRRGFKEKVFAKYFKAPRTLYQTKLQIPILSADGAPAAFECDKEVQPKRWLVVYRGAVQAPKSGRYRFVGACDDIMVVRFNNRPVFDYGYTIAGVGATNYGRSAEMSGATQNSELAKEIRKLTPMRLPISFYKYTQTPTYNQNIGGMAIGPEFDAKAGQTYPIEILIGEIPGGSFGVSLLIEEMGVNYQKDPGGAPILPLFRLDHSLPNPDLKGEAPPFDPTGLPWKSVQTGVNPDI